jgi:hypothetical protein
MYRLFEEISGKYMSEFRYILLEDFIFDIFIKRFVHQFLGVAQSSMSFEDRRVCRPFLLNCCPHEILTGTVSVYFDEFSILTFPFSEVGFR